MLESRHVNSIPIRNQWHRRKRRSQGQRRYLSTYGSVGCFGKSGGEKQWTASVLCEICKTLADRKSPCVRRFATPFDGPVVPCWAEFNLIQSPRKTQVISVTWAQRYFQEFFIGCALGSGGGWTGDLIIADWRTTLRTTSRQKFTSRGSSPKKLDSRNCRKHSYFFCADGSQDKKVKPYATRELRQGEGVARSDPLQSAKDNPLQAEGGVADSSEVSRRYGSKGRFLVYWNFSVAKMLCPEHNRMC